tara:strand:- start:933 stop:1109 length:177 start_codon:yes stop_codon:yes gene_type:complete
MKNIYEKKLTNDILVSVSEGEKGEFKILFEDDVIFDKSKTDRFPKDGEILKLIGEVLK